MGKLTELCSFLDPDPELLRESANKTTNPKFHALNGALVQLVRSHTALACHTITHGIFVPKPRSKTSTWSNSSHSTLRTKTRSAPSSPTSTTQFSTSLRAR